MDRFDKRDMAVSAALFAAGLAYSLFYFDYGINLLDEGYLVDAVQKVMDGQVPYRDFHHVYAPGSFYLFAALFKLFGEDLLVIRAFWAVLHGLLAVLVYLAGRRMLPRAYAAVPAVLIPFAPGPWHKGFFVLLPFACLLAYIHAWKKDDAGWYAAAGMVTGLSLIFRQDVGVYAFLTFIAVSSVMPGMGRAGRMKAIAGYCAGFGLPLAAVAALFWQWGALSEAFVQVFFAGAADIKSAAIDFPPLLPLWAGSAKDTLLDKFFYLPILVYVSAWVVILRGLLRFGLAGVDREFAAAALMGSLIMNQVRSRSDLSHLWQVTPLAILVAAVLLHRTAARLQDRPYARPLAAALGGVLSAWVVAAALASPASGSVALMRGQTHLLGIPAARVYVSGQWGRDMEGLVAFLGREAPDDVYVFAAPDISLLYLLAGRKNPGFFGHYALGRSDTPAYQEKVIGMLKAKGVRYVVLNRREATDGRPEKAMASHSKLLYGYIMDNYGKVYESGPFVVLRLGSIEG